MPSVADVTLLYSKQTGPIRAWTLGESTQTYSKRIQTLWLPDLRVSGDVLVETSRGMIPGGQVKKDDWIKVVREPAEDVQSELPYELAGSTKQVWEWAQQTRFYALLDMMDCPRHIAHWRRDHWCMQPRAMEPWYVKYAQEGADSLWLRVLEANDSLVRLVTVNGSWRAYGVPIST
jgi:hypothetical protein